MHIKKDNQRKKYSSIPTRHQRSKKNRVRRFRDKPQYVKIVHLLPNVLTSFNIGCGITAVLFAIDGKAEIAAFLILLSVFFDMVDGKVARFVGAASPFGVELDSLADVISFGVAPALILHTLLYPGDLSRLSVSLVLVYALSTALRLARYNVEAMKNKKREHFTGLPCPVPAFFIATTILFCHEYGIVFDHTITKIVFHVLTVCLACLMLSTVPYPDLSSMQVKKKNVYQYNVIMVLILCVTVLKFKIVLMLLSGAFILIGPFFLWQTQEQKETSARVESSKPPTVLEKSPLNEPKH